MIRPFYVAALVLGSLHAASTTRAGTFDDCMRKIGLCYSAGYHSGTPGPAAGCNHFHWKSTCAWAPAGTLGGRCGCDCQPCATPCCEPCAAPCAAPCFPPRHRMSPCGTPPCGNAAPWGVGGRPPAGVY